MCRDSEGETAAFANDAGHPDFSPMHLHEFFRDRQTKPDSLRFISARLTHLIELVENPAGFFRRNARARVGYGNL